MKKRYMHPNDDTNILDTDILDLKDELAKLTEQLEEDQVRKGPQNQSAKKTAKNLGKIKSVRLMILAVTKAKINLTLKD